MEVSEKGMSLSALAHLQRLPRQIEVQRMLAHFSVLSQPLFKIVFLDSTEPANSYHVSVSY